MRLFKKKNTDEKEIKFSSCNKCHKSTYVNQNFKLRIGITLYKYKEFYYCIDHHPDRKRLMRDVHSAEFARAIDQMCKIVGEKKGLKKLRSKERKVKVSDTM